MPKRKKATETVVGIFVLASIGLILVLVILLGTQQNIFESHYEIIGTFGSVGGLQTGAEVQLAGINVGYVKGITFGHDNRVDVIMSIKSVQKERVRQDSMASIKTEGLMGDLYIDITVGSNKLPVIPSAGIIRTSEPFGLAELFESLNPSLKGLGTTINNLSTLTAKLADYGGKLGDFMDNLDLIAVDLRQGRGTIGALLKNDDLYKKADKLLDTTLITVEDFDRVAKKTHQVSSELTPIIAEVGSSIQKFGKFSVEAEKTAKGVTDIVHSAKKVMTDVKTIAENFKDASEDVKATGHRLRVVIESVDDGVREAREVIGAAKKSWLIRADFPPAVPVHPIVEETRDEAQPKITP